MARAQDSKKFLVLENDYCAGREVVHVAYDYDTEEEAIAQADARLATGYNVVVAQLLDVALPSPKAQWRNQVVAGETDAGFSDWLRNNEDKL